MIRYIPLLAFLFLISCGSEKTITFSEPKGSTIWEKSDKIHQVSWHDERNKKTLGDDSMLLLYQDDKVLQPMNIYMSDDGELMVRHPLEVAAGSNFRLKFEDGLKREGFSDYFTIKQ